MIGRFVGFVIGLAVMVLGYALWKPATFAQYVDLAHIDLGPFAAYRTIVCGVIAAVGLVIALAALQRPRRQSFRPATTMFSSND